jgi:hypothetical protein
MKEMAAFDVGSHEIEATAAAGAIASGEHWKLNVWSEKVGGLWETG